MDPISVVDNLGHEILDVSEKIYNFAEIGSEEFKSSSLLAERLKAHGFRVTKEYMGIKTSFRAEFGGTGPAIGFLAEYDALPNGHSCGHNLIAAWAFGCAVALSKSAANGRIVVLGTPSEEGIGEYAGSKVFLANNGAFRDLDVAFGMHPDDKWAVGSKSLSDITIRFTYKGRTSHGSESPEKGINALDAAVSAYNGINSLRGWAKNDKHIVVGMVFREAGKATNVIPDRAILDVELRSTSGEFLMKLAEKIKKLAVGISNAFGTEIDIESITPLYEDYLPNNMLDNLLEEELKNISIKPENIDLSNDVPSGSTDEGNVSKVVPTGHIDVQIAKESLPGHSDEFREASNSPLAKENLLNGISATVQSCLRLFNNPELIDKARKEFFNSKGE